ncbi:MAG: zinc ribbon domain-containing protein [bacterium]
MPIYEFCCDQCHHEFECLILSKQDALDNICPKCNSRKINRQMSRFGFGGNTASNSGGGSSKSCHSCSSGSCHTCH